MTGKLIISVPQTPTQFRLKFSSSDERGGRESMKDQVRQEAQRELGVVDGVYTVRSQSFMLETESEKLRDR